jgi:hypothetical protein
VHVGERRALNYYSAEVFHVFDFKTDLRRVPLPFISLLGSFLIPSLLSASVIAKAEISNISVIKNRPLCSRHLDIAYPSRMPFYLYGTRQEIHIDHILVQAPNAQLSAGEVTLDLIEGSEPVFAEGLRNGLVAMADALPEHLMRPFTSDRIVSFFHPGAKLDLSIYLDDDVAQSQGSDFCDKLGEPIARTRITLGGNTFVDEYMINLDVSVAMSQSLTNSLSGSFPEVTLALQDHPMFHGCAPRGTIDRHASMGGVKSWREVWDTALAGRKFADIDSDPAFHDSTESDTESDVNSQVLWFSTPTFTRFET